MKNISSNLTFRFSLLNLFLLLLLTTPLSVSAQVQIHTGDLFLDSQAAVDAFSYTEVTGELIISGSDINNLDGLSSLTKVKTLDINNNPLLTNLDGLSALTAVELLDISNNAALADLNGLSSLTTVGLNESFWQDASLKISSNNALTNLDGLSSLISVGGMISISNNNSLTDLDGLSHVTSVGFGLNIYMNPSLAGFCGLYPLLNGGSTGSYYNVNDNLDNPTMADIIAGGACTLDPAQLIADLVDGGALNQGQANALKTKLNNCRLNAFNNLTNAWVSAGILSQQQTDDLDAAAEQHCTPASRIATQQVFTLGQNYPNPTSGNTVIPFTLATSAKVSIQLYDAAGKMVRNVMDEYITEGSHEVKVNLHSVPAGTYFYKVQVGEYSEMLPMVVE